MEALTNNEMEKILGGRWYYLSDGRCYYVPDDDEEEDDTIFI